MGNMGKISFYRIKKLLVTAKNVKQFWTHTLNMLLQYLLFVDWLFIRRLKQKSFKIFAFSSFSIWEIELIFKGQETTKKSPSDPASDVTESENGSFDILRKGFKSTSDVNGARTGAHNVAFEIDHFAAKDSTQVRNSGFNSTNDVTRTGFRPTNDITKAGFRPTNDITRTGFRPTNDITRTGFMPTNDVTRIEDAAKIGVSLVALTKSFQVSKKEEK